MIAITRQQWERGITRMQLPASVYRVLTALWSVVDYSTGRARWAMAFRRLRHRCGLMARTTIQWALRWMQRAGLLFAEARDETGTWWRFDLPDEIRRAIGLPLHAAEEIEADEELQRSFERARMQMAAEDLAPGKRPGAPDQQAARLSVDAPEPSEDAPAGYETQGAMLWLDAMLEELEPAPVEPPKPSILDRIGALAKRVVGLAPAEPIVPALHHPHRVQPIDTAPVVPFTGGFGPEPTFIPRPSFSAPMTSGVIAELDDARGRGGDPTKLADAFGGKLALPPNPEERERRLRDREAGRDGPKGRERTQRSAGQHEFDGIPPPEHEAAPAEHARNVGRLYASREEAHRARTYERPPGVMGSADEAPHRRVLLEYREQHWQHRGCEPLWDTPEEHARVKRMLERHNDLDYVLDLIRRGMRAAYGGRGMSLRGIEAMGRREHEGAEMERLEAMGVDMSIEGQMSRWTPEERRKYG